uniref:ACB domain-containing protein n=1 Tax=Chenopodium quinoa TaxID=63459 RepID=A0A803L2H7_CHEQI
MIMASKTLIYVIVPLIIRILGVESNIGVNYGVNADNLPPPEEVAKFLVNSTYINRVRIFDANPDILQAFAHTGVNITVTIPNVMIPLFTNFTFAQEWVKSNEVLATTNKLLITNLVPAMETLYTALVVESLERKVQVSTPHSLGILSSSNPPSTGRFRLGYDVHVLWSLLSFLRDIGSPFMVNPYPFFDIDSNEIDLNYALFGPNSGVLDEYTAETGWPSQGELDHAGVDLRSAATYNGNVVRHVRSGLGTPLMPNRTFETYLFALFDENLKMGPAYERHFGLFSPNFVPIYDIGLLRPNKAYSAPPNGFICFFMIITITGVESTELDEAFSAATAFVAASAADKIMAQKVGNDAQLQLYGLYKIATEGIKALQYDDQNIKFSNLLYITLGEHESLTHPSQNAWQKMGAMPPEDAMQKYVDIVTELFPSWASGGAEKTKNGDAEEHSSDPKGPMGPVFSSFIHEEDSGVEMKMDAIHAFAREGDVENLLKCIENGISPNSKDSEGRTPLHWAVDRGHLPVIDLLYSKDADINAKDNEGQTALHYAVVCDREAIAEYLVKHNADVDIKDNDGASPSELCEKNWPWMRATDKVVE